MSTVPQPLSPLQGPSHFHSLLVPNLILSILAWASLWKTHYTAAASLTRLDAADGDALCLTHIHRLSVKLSGWNIIIKF